MDTLEEERERDSFYDMQLFTCLGVKVLCTRLVSGNSGFTLFQEQSNTCVHCLGHSLFVFLLFLLKSVRLGNKNVLS